MAGWYGGNCGCCNPGCSTCNGCGLQVGSKVYYDLTISGVTGSGNCGGGINDCDNIWNTTHRVEYIVNSLDNSEGGYQSGNTTAFGCFCYTASGISEATCSRGIEAYIYSDTPCYDSSCYCFDSGTYLYSATLQINNFTSITTATDVYSVSPELTNQQFTLDEGIPAVGNNPLCKVGIRDRIIDPTNYNNCGFSNTSYFPIMVSSDLQYEDGDVSSSTGLYLEALVVYWSGEYRTSAIYSGIPDPICGEGTFTLNSGTQNTQLTNYCNFSSPTSVDADINIGSSVTVTTSTRPVEPDPTGGSYIEVYIRDQNSFIVLYTNSGVDTLCCSGTYPMHVAKSSNPFTPSGNFILNGCDFTDATFTLNVSYSGCPKQECLDEGDSCITGCSEHPVIDPSWPKQCYCSGTTYVTGTSIDFSNTTMELGCTNFVDGNHLLSDDCTFTPPCCQWIATNLIGGGDTYFDYTSGGDLTCICKNFSAGSLGMSADVDVYQKDDGDFYVLAIVEVQHTATQNAFWYFSQTIPSGNMTCDPFSVNLDLAQVPLIGKIDNCDNLAPVWPADLNNTVVTVNFNE